MSDLQIYTSGENNLLNFGLATNPQMVRGVAQLVQQVVVDLLSDFDPVTNRGSNLGKRLQEITDDDQPTAEQIVSESVRLTQTHILKQQEGNSSIRADERLQELRVVNVEPAGNLTWKIELELIPIRGAPIVFEVPRLT